MLSQFGLVPTKAKAVSVGDKFGRLTVLAVGQRPNTYYYAAVCQCECGSVPRVVKFYNLTSGQSISCGCYHKERITKHHLYKSPHYRRWGHMMSRCYDQNCPAYPDYGARGIRVCADWHDLVQFINGLPPGFMPGLEMDRINNDGDYEPGNIRWATRQQNADNRRPSRRLTYLGRTKSLSTWARTYGLTPTQVKTRIDELGWSLESALTIPVADRTENMRRAQTFRWKGHIKRPQPKPLVVKTFIFEGEMRTIAQLSALTGISINLLRKRICERDWSIDKATRDRTTIPQEPT